MAHKTGFLRAFLEAAVPAWLVLGGLMVAARGDLKGNAGLVMMAALLFPGIWGAVCLQSGQGSWLHRLFRSLLFAAGQGLGIVLLLLVLRQVLVWLGWLEPLEESSMGKIFLFGSLPALLFLLMRIPGVVRPARRGWHFRMGRLRPALNRSAGLALVILVLAGLLYSWISRPYTGHASFQELQIASARAAGPGSNMGKWQCESRAGCVIAENHSLQLLSAAQPFSILFKVEKGRLAGMDGLRMHGRSEKAATLTLEARETGGARYRAWGDLLPGGWQELQFVDFIPIASSSQDDDGKLGWEQVEQLTLLVYQVQSGTPVQLEQIEMLALEPGSRPVWQMTSSEHFWIRFHPADQGAAADILQSLEARYNSIHMLIGNTPAGQVPVTVASSHAELEQLGGSARPAWVLAAALPDSIVLLSPRRYSPLFNGHSYNDVQQIAPHELVHWMLVQKLGFPAMLAVPDWLNEGLAVSLAGQEVNEAALQKAARQGKLPALSQSAVSTGVFNSYNMGGSFIHYWFTAYGEGTLAPVLDQLAKGEPLDTALQQSAGMSLELLEQKWQQQLAGHAAQTLQIP
jgi:hypothetical protein